MYRDSPPKKLVFYGTPEFAIPTLDALVTSPSFEVIAVVTQPDKPAGRGQRLTPPAVKHRALELGIPVFQPESIKSVKSIEEAGKTRFSGNYGGGNSA